MKGRAEKDGKLTDLHEKENKRTDEDAERACLQLDTPEYKKGYVAQLDSGQGPTIHGRVVVHKMGPTVLHHLQKEQYLRYWNTRPRAGAWARNADTEGHAAACRWAQKANPNTLPSGSYKEINSQFLTHDLEHHRDHKYNPSGLATEAE